MVKIIYVASTIVKIIGYISENICTNYIFYNSSTTLGLFCLE